MSYVTALPPSHIQPQTSPASVPALEVDRSSKVVLADIKFGSPGRSQAMGELVALANSYSLFHSFAGLSAFERATNFLTALPPNVSPPEFSVDPDGDVAFDWINGDDVVSVSLSASGRLCYVADIAGTLTSGTKFFGSVVPAEVLAELSRID